MCFTNKGALDALLRGQIKVPLTGCHFTEDLERLGVSWLDCVQPA